MDTAVKKREGLLSGKVTLLFLANPQFAGIAEAIEIEIAPKAIDIRIFFFQSHCKDALFYLRSIAAVIDTSLVKIFMNKTNRSVVPLT